jgi:hypothetical protein
MDGPVARPMAWKRPLQLLATMAETRLAFRERSLLVAFRSGDAWRSP